jgi:hypothetical protein
MKNSHFVFVLFVISAVDFCPCFRSSSSGFEPSVCHRQQFSSVETVLWFRFRWRSRSFFLFALFVSCAEVSSAQFASSFLVSRSWASTGRARSNFLSDLGAVGFPARDQVARATLAAQIDFGCCRFLLPRAILVLVFGQALRRAELPARSLLQRQALATRRRFSPKSRPRFSSLVFSAFASDFPVSAAGTHFPAPRGFAGCRLAFPRLVRLGL